MIQKGAFRSISRGRIPRLRPDLVERKELLAQLEAHAHCALSLLVAPAGYGKTTLAAAWSRRQTEPVAWMSLDVREDDAQRFLQALVDALGQVVPEVAEQVGPLLDAIPALPAGDILHALLEVFEDVCISPCLVLDDVHILHSPEVHEIICELIESWPYGGRICVTTRRWPEWPLHRWRARAQVFELDIQQLRFRESEALSFLQQTMLLPLHREDCIKLVSYTDGWIAGLQLAALSYRKHAEPTAFLSQLKGKNQFIFEYLHQEVFSQLPEALQSFLLKTSILEHLHTSLCEALVGDGKSQEHLAFLERSNIFLWPLDTKGNWFRYHPLFAELLQARLKEMGEDFVKDLHRKASLWFSQHERFEEASVHALAAGEPRRAAELMAAQGFLMLRENKWSRLQLGLHHFSQEDLMQHPQLMIFSLVSRCMKGQWSPHDEHLLAQLAEVIASAPTEPTDPQRDLLGQLAWLRCHVAWSQRDLEKSQEYALLALQQLPLERRQIRAQILSIVGFFSQYLNADLQAVHAENSALLDDLEQNQWGGDAHVYTLWRWAWQALRMGEPHLAMERCQRMLEDIRDPHRPKIGSEGFLAPIYAMIGNIYWEWNQLDEARTWIERAVSVLNEDLGWGWQQYVYVAYAVFLHQHKGDIDGAYEAIRKARAAHFPGIPLALEPAGIFEVMLRLAQGDLGTAIQWTEQSGLSIEGPLNDQMEMPQIAHLAILLLQHRLPEAGRLLERMLSFAKDNHRVRTEIELMLWGAIHAERLSNTQEARTLIEEAIVLAQSGGFVRVFVEKRAMLGHLYAALLCETSALRTRCAESYIQQLLSALSLEAPSSPEIPMEPFAQLLEQEGEALLSRREEEILLHVATGMANREIASALHISPETVKKHVKHIFQKLEVKSRTQAVSRARMLGIL